MILYAMQLYFNQKIITKTKLNLLGLDFIVARKTNCNNIRITAHRLLQAFNEQNDLSN